MQGADLNGFADPMNTSPLKNDYTQGNITLTFPNITDAVGGFPRDRLNSKGGHRRKTGMYVYIRQR